MSHALLCRGDPQGRRVVVRPEVCRLEPGLGRRRQAREQGHAALAQDQLRRFHHYLESQHALFEPQLALDAQEQGRENAHLLDQRHLGEREYQVLGQLAGLLEQRAEEQAQRPHAPSPQLLGERLDAHPDEPWQARRSMALRHLSRGGRHVAILFGIGPRAVAVLEIDAEVLDRLARQLLHDARVDRRRERPQAQRHIQSARVRGVLGERAASHLAQLRRGVGAEQVAAAVDHVHGLPARRVAGVERHERQVRSAQRVEQRGLRRGQRRIELHGRSYFQLRRLPALSHSIEVAMRWSRVAGCFASVIHSR